MAFGLAVYASQCGLPTPHARLASGRWSGATGRAFHPQDPAERFQSCFLTSHPPFPSFLPQSHRPLTHQLNNARIGSPLDSNEMGRPEKSVGDNSGEIPRKRYIVANRSVGPSGRSGGTAPLASLEPMNWPCRKPPPAKRLGELWQTYGTASPCVRSVVRAGRSLGRKSC